MTADSSAWCTIEHNNQIFQARVVHVGGGKFKILEDNQQDLYVGNIIDASDIFGCDVQKSNIKARIK